MSRREGWVISEGIDHHGSEAFRFDSKFLGDSGGSWEILEVPGRFWRFLGEVCKGRAAAAHICSRARPAPGGSGGAPEGVAAPMCLRATMKRQLKWLWSIEN